MKVATMLPGRKLEHLAGRHIGTLNLKELVTFLTCRADPISPEPLWLRRYRFMCWLLPWR